jgi:pilus assembly protein CpaC
VTPHFVKPLDMAQQTLPTDTFTEPNDWEFYLMGVTDGFGYTPQAKQARDGRVAEATVSRRLEGEFGHMVQ